MMYIFQILQIMLFFSSKKQIALVLKSNVLYIEYVLSCYLVLIMIPNSVNATQSNVFF